MSTLKATNIQNASSATTNITLNTSGGVAFPALTGLMKANGSSAVTAATAGTDFISPSTAGARVILNTLTASNSAALQDTTSLTSTYSAYELEFINIRPTTGGASITLQVYSGGAYKTTTYNSGNNLTASTGVVSSSISLCGTPGTVGAAEPGACGSVFIKAPSQTTYYKMIYGQFGASTGDTNGTFTGQIYNVTAGYWAGGTGAVAGFQILMSAGNISSGTVKVWGIV